MFQYCIGMHLAIKNNTYLVLDLDEVSNNTKKEREHTKRSFELDIFNVKYIDSKRIKFYLWVMNMLNKIKIVNEDNFNFDKAVLQLSGNICLEGYWQNENYFIDISTLVRKNFQFVPLQNDKNIQLEKIITNCESVSVHFRRGDYITNKHAENFHGICSMEYYMNAIELIEAEVKNPIYFIFSDEIGWVKQNFSTNRKTVFIEGNKDNISFEDLRLMSRCKHNIIANSSFSWWGAWLNVNKEKIVIAPNRWFESEEHKLNDIVPESWIKI